MLLPRCLHAENVNVTTQEGLLRQKNQLDAYVAWHRQQGLAPSLDEMMSMPSTNERWAQDGGTGGLKGAPKVTVILNLFMREVRGDIDKQARDRAAGYSSGKEVGARGKEERQERKVEWGWEMGLSALLTVCLIRANYVIGQSKTKTT